jgi:hypothetical protein
LAYLTGWNWRCLPSITEFWQKRQQLQWQRLRRRGKFFKQVEFNGSDKSRSHFLFAR